MVNENAGAASDVAATKKFSVGQVLLKNVSFDAPKAVELPKKAKDVDMDKVDFNLTSKAWRFLENRYALEVHFDVHATRDGETVFRVAVDEIGTFAVVGYTEEEVDGLLRTKGVEAIYPYARELIHSLASRCGVQRLGLPAVGLGFATETAESSIVAPPPPG